MVEYGADINVRNNNGLTLMHQAANNYRNVLNESKGLESSDEMVLFYLLDQGANVHAQDKWERTPFDVLVKAKAHLIKPDIIQAFVVRGIDLNKSSPITGTNILHRAVETKNTDLIQCLADDQGMDINQRTRDGYTPFQLGIIKHGDLDTLDMLLKHKADINARDADGRTALAIAEEVRQNIIQWLFNRGAKH